MKSRQRMQPPESKTSRSPGPVRCGTRSAKAFIAVAVLGVILALAWWWNRPPQVPLPVVDLQAVEPKVAVTLQERMDEVIRRPRSGPAWGWLGALLWAYDFRPAARECLAQAERLEPDNPRWPYYHALSLMIATPNQAIPLLRKTVQICGNFPETPRFRLAHLLAEQGRWDEARREFEPLLAERPHFAPARLLAARAAQQSGELDQAIQLARGCTEDPRTARAAFVFLGTLHRQKDDTAASAQALQRASALPDDDGIEDPYHSEVTLLRGDARALSEEAHPLLAAGHIPQAAALIDRLRQEHPEHPETWLLAGRLQFLRKDVQEAEPLLRRHLEIDPRSTQGFFQLGLVLLGQERFAEAAVSFEKAIELKPDFGPAHYNRAVAQARAGQPRAAIDSFRESIRHNPERLESYLLLADTHLRLGEREPARALLEQAQTINPADPRLKTLLNRALHPTTQSTAQ